MKKKWICLIMSAVLSLAQLPGFWPGASVTAMAAGMKSSEKGTADMGTGAEAAAEEAAAAGAAAEKSVAEEAAMEKAAAERTSADEAAAEETAAEEAVTEETAAEETAAEEAAIEEAVTEETGSEETAAEETAPEESAPEGSASEKENPQGLTSGVRQLVPREAAAAAEALFPEEPAQGTTAGEAPSAAGETEQDPAEEPQQETGGEEPARENPDLAISSPSAVLMEVSTGTILYEKDAHEARSPASITKIMTLLLIFQELEAGNITLDEMVTTSAHAKSMGGSQVYLEEGEQQTVETLIKCIVVASGNDASVAMAEHIAGSEEEFVSRMNQEAERLGLENTHFEDCCGLTESTGHYTTAADVAVMSRQLVDRYPQVLEYSSIWMENITHETRQGTTEFGLTNTNKMIRTYEGCVGLKTGSTSVAKYCVSSVAQRDGMTMLAVIMAAPDPKTRFADAAVLLNYGFGSCSLYVDEDTAPGAPAEVKGGVEEEVSWEYEEPFRYLDTGGAALDAVEKELEIRQVKAPVKKGDVVGRAVYRLNGQEIGSIRLISSQEVRKAGYGDALKKAAGYLIAGVRL